MQGSVRSVKHLRQRLKWLKARQDRRKWRWIRLIQPKGDRKNGSSTFENNSGRFSLAFCLHGLRVLCRSPGRLSLLSSPPWLFWVRMAFFAPAVTSVGLSFRDWRYVEQEGIKGEMTYWWTRKKSENTPFAVIPAKAGIQINYRNGGKRVSPEWRPFYETIENSIFEVDTPVASVRAYGASRFNVDVYEDGYTEVFVMSCDVYVQGQNGNTKIDPGSMLSIGTDQDAELSPMRQGWWLGSMESIKRSLLNPTVELLIPTRAKRRKVNPVRNSSRRDSKPSGALNPAGIILKM